MSETRAFDTATLGEIVQSLSEKLKAYYVFPDVAGEICTPLPTAWLSSQ